MVKIQSKSKGLAKRIVPCLDVKNGETVKAVSYTHLPLPRQNTFFLIAHRSTKIISIPASSIRKRAERWENGLDVYKRQLYGLSIEHVPPYLYSPDSGAVLLRSVRLTKVNKTTENSYKL